MFKNKFKKSKVKSLKSCKVINKREILQHKTLYRRVMTCSADPICACLILDLFGDNIVLLQVKVVRYIVKIILLNLKLTFGTSSTYCLSENNINLDEGYTEI